MSWQLYWRKYSWFALATTCSRIARVTISGVIIEPLMSDSPSYSHLQVSRRWQYFRRIDADLLSSRWSAKWAYKPELGSLASSNQIKSIVTSWRWSYLTGSFFLMHCVMTPNAPSILTRHVTCRRSTGQIGKENPSPADSVRAGPTMTNSGSAVTKRKQKVNLAIHW
jgi:hypothetical protein